MDQAIEHYNNHRNAFAPKGEDSSAGPEKAIPKGIQPNVFAITASEGKDNCTWCLLKMVFVDLEL